MDEIRQAYIAESQELLVSLEENLLRLEQEPTDADAINAVFRVAHTIKGGAGIVECDYIVAFTHVLENALDGARDGLIRIDSDLIQILLASGDQIARLIEFAADPEARPDAETLAKGEELLTALRRYSPARDEPAAGLPSTSEAQFHASGGGLLGHDCWHISIRFGENVLREGMDPASFIRYLASFGEISHMTTLLDTLPAAETADPEACYLGFEIDFRAETSKEKIERVFDFVRESCLLRILPPHSEVSQYIDLIMSLPESSMRLGEILTKAGVITQAELDAALAVQQDRRPEEGGSGGPVKQLGEILVGQQVVQNELVEAAVAKQVQVSEKKTQESRLIRVQADKLDQLINLVGELVIAGASAAMLAQKAKDAAMFEATSVVSRLVEEIRDGALQLRMVQIGETFNRFHRVVRDVSKEMDKEIDLVITGADTELDKTVVEKIGDPLMHLVRNAVDHGIEPKAARVAKGKPEKGTLRLNAYHESGSIVIEVTDDGGGLDKVRILAKAVEKGLVAEGTELSDQDVYKLIFEPGFSTAAQVTNLSGRGVGMDVVRRNIEALRGSVHIDSQAGKGTNIAIRLPLTLAIIDGFLTGVGEAAYVVPLDLVEECIELSSEVADRNYLNLRGEVLPFIRLRQQFGHGGPKRRRQSVVVVRYAGKRAGLVVDELMGEFQTVIKPLGPVFSHLKGIAGSTILGSGEVALILDVPALIARTTNPGAEHASERLGLAA